MARSESIVKHDLGFVPASHRCLRSRYDPWRTTKRALICRLLSSLKSLPLSLAGGASTQVTFLPQTDVLASFFPIVLPPAAGRSNLAGVFSHSYLHYGINEAVNRYADGIAA